MEQLDYTEFYGEYKICFNKKEKSIVNKYTVIPLIILLLLIVGYVLIIDYIPNFKQISMYEAVPAFEYNKIGVVIEDKPIKLENLPIFYENEVLVPIELIKENFDKDIFWDEVQNILVITTQGKVLKMKTDELNLYINGEPININVPIKLFSEVPYVPINLFADFYELDVKYVEKTAILIIDNKNLVHKKGNIKIKKTKLRQAATIKSPWLDELVKDAEINVYDSYNDWTYVRTSDGLLGYIKSNNIYNIIEHKYEDIKQEIVFNEKWKPTGERISLLWRQVFKPENVNTKTLNQYEGVNVLSPTWFHIINADGDIKNYADKKYVDWAHRNGYKVWALITNPFTDKEMTHQVLSNTETREKLIKKLLVYAKLYELDGINVDFESLDPKTGPYYVQFFREFSPYMAEQDLILSVDMYVPSAYTAFYNRSEVAKLVDYICVMAYDEHWSTSPISGSVASADWVEEGIIKTLLEVPKEKLLMGIPFYARLWTEKDGVLIEKPKALSMNSVQNLIKENKALLKWLEDDKQYYAEWYIKGITYKMWIEDEKSIEEKLNIMKKYDLAGIAAWKEGMEKEDIWDIIDEAIKKD